MRRILLTVALVGALLEAAALPVAGAESVSIDIDPAENVRSGAAVEVTGSGFEGGQLVYAAVCDSDADASTVWSQCDVGGYGSVRADDQGDVTLSVTAHKRFGNVSCDEPGDCVVLAGNPFDPDQPFASTPVSFAAGAPRLGIFPWWSLDDGQPVFVFMADYAPHATLAVGQCRADPQDVFEDCDTSSYRLVSTNGAGAALALTRVRGVITVGGSRIDCTAEPGACELGAVDIASFAEQATVPLRFG